MTKKLTDKLEVMVVDDNSNQLKTMEDFLTDRGYDIVTADDSYKAIHQLAIRIFKNQPLPEILLCDLQDRRYDLAVINRIDPKISWERRTEIVTIHPSMVFNVYNYLHSQGLKAEALIGFTSCASDEDIETARRLKIPLIEKHKISKAFPNVSGMNYTDARLVFELNSSENFRGSE
jgi:CheY-like chemotaxis protein